MDDGETHQQLLDDRTAFEDYDPDPARTQGYGFAHLQRLALQHLLDAR
jgi:xylose isomerase